MTPTMHVDERTDDTLIERNTKISEKFSDPNCGSQQFPERGSTEALKKPPRTPTVDYVSEAIL